MPSPDVSFRRSTTGLDWRKATVQRPLSISGYPGRNSWKIRTFRSIKGTGEPEGLYEGSIRSGLSGVTRGSPSVRISPRSW